MAIEQFPGVGFGRPGKGVTKKSWALFRGPPSPSESCSLGRASPWPARPMRAVLTNITPKELLGHRAQGSGALGSQVQRAQGSWRGSRLAGPKGKGLPVGDLTRPGHKARRI